MSAAILALLLLYAARGVAQSFYNESCRAFGGRSMLQVDASGSAFPVADEIRKRHSNPRGGDVAGTERGAEEAAAGTNVNPCEGTKPTSGYDNIECMTRDVPNVAEQAGTDVTPGYTGKLEAAGTPIKTSFKEAGLCPVNVHFHRGTEHRSEGQYDEAGTGPSYQAHDERLGFQCRHYSDSDPMFTTEYDWKHCEGMHVGETYEVHWPHSKGGACGSEHQYQTPFYDGVFCHAERLWPTTYESIGVQAQVFTIVNDEAFSYPDLMSGMIVDSERGTDIAMYTGSTTGTSRDNKICSQYAPITWHVDRKCHLISASSFDKMCADMGSQHDDMSDDMHPHGSRELVADWLAANQNQR